MRRGILLTSVALAACAQLSPAAPAPASVTPAQGAEATPSDVEIRGDNFFATVVTNFKNAAKSSLDQTFQAALIDELGGELPLEAVELVDTHTLKATAPAAPRGLYDLRVTGPGGATGVLPAAFRVVTSAENVSRFELDPIGPQHVRIPFAVGITAVDELGRTVEGFTGTVTLADSTMAFSLVTAPFVLGRFHGFAQLDQLASGNVLHAVDGLGHGGDSLPFDVVAGLSTALRFSAGPTQTTAGSCAGPFSLDVEDAFGAPAAVGADLSVTLSANPPEGIVFFGSADCATPKAALTVVQGSSRLDFFLTAARSGTPVLRAAPATVPSVTSVLTVAPGPAAALAFSSPAQVLAAGACSQAVQVEARDAFGNPAPVIGEVSIDAVAPAGVTLHSDPACAEALGALFIVPGASAASFYFRSPAPRTFALTATAASLGSASQDEEVTP